MSEAKKKRKYTPREKPSRDFLTENNLTHTDVVEAIRTTKSLAEAARTLNTSRTTLYKYLEKEDIVIQRPEIKNKRHRTRMRRLMKELNRIPDLRTKNIILETDDGPFTTKVLRGYTLKLTDEKEVLFLGRTFNNKIVSMKLPFTDFMNTFKEYI